MPSPRWRCARCRCDRAGRRADRPRAIRHRPWRVRGRDRPGTSAGHGHEFSEIRGRRLLRRRPGAPFGPARDASREAGEDRGHSSRDRSRAQKRRVSRHPARAHERDGHSPQGRHDLHGEVRARHGDLRLLHLHRRPAVARLRRRPQPGRPGLRRLRPRRRRGWTSCARSTRRRRRARTSRRRSRSRVPRAWFRSNRGFTQRASTSSREWPSFR